MSIRNSLGFDRSILSGAFKAGGNADSKVTEEEVNLGV